MPITKTERITAVCDAPKCVRGSTGVVPGPMKVSWQVEDMRADPPTTPEELYPFISVTLVDNSVRHFCCVRCLLNTLRDNPDSFRIKSPRELKQEQADKDRAAKIDAGQSPNVGIAPLSPIGDGPHSVAPLTPDAGA